MRTRRPRQWRRRGLGGSRRPRVATSPVTPSSSVANAGPVGVERAAPRGRRGRRRCLRRPAPRTRSTTCAMPASSASSETAPPGGGLAVVTAASWRPTTVSAAASSSSVSRSNAAPSRPAVSSSGFAVASSAGNSSDQWGAACAAITRARSRSRVSASPRPWITCRSAVAASGSSGLSPAAASTTAAASSGSARKSNATLSGSSRNALAADVFSPASATAAAWVSSSSDPSSVQATTQPATANTSVTVAATAVRRPLIDGSGPARRACRRSRSSRCASPAGGRARLRARPPGCSAAGRRPSRR